MKPLLVEKDRETQRVYNTTLVRPESLSIFSNELSIKIIRELAKQPQCAMDVARKLKEHEQNVYYHLKRMRDAGLIHLVSEENRYGMTAKIYEIVSPVIATKLDEDGYKISKNKSLPSDPEIEEFLDPFIKNAILNSIIVLGEPHQHGRFEGRARDSPYAVDVALFLGIYLHGLNTINYKLDVEILEKDLKNNLILIGNSKNNTVVDKINSKLPIYFDENNDWTIVSKLSDKKYGYDYDAVIERIKNPFDKEKEILILAGKRSVALKSAAIAFTHNLDEIMKGNINNSKVIAKVVSGIDKDGDGIIDSVKFLE